MAERKELKALLYSAAAPTEEQKRRLGAFIERTYGGIRLRKSAYFVMNEIIVKLM